MNIDCSCIESNASSFLYNHPLGVQVLSPAGSSKVVFDFDSSMKNLHLLLILAVVTIYATVRVGCISDVAANLKKGLLGFLQRHSPPAQCIASCRNVCASASNCISHVCKCSSFGGGARMHALPCCSFDEQCCE